MVNSPSLNGDHQPHADADADADADGHCCDGHAHGDAEALIAQAHLLHQSSNSTPSTTAQTPMTTLQLLQQFLKAQSTRTSIANELVIAFSEPNITDLALNKVIQISSAGLLQVKSECQAVITLLSDRVDGAAAASNGSTMSTGQVDDVRKMISECKAIERLEKERIAEETKRLQLLRIGKLNDMAAEELQEAGGAGSQGSSEAACMVEQRQKMESIKSAMEISQRKVQSLVEDINEHLQEIREYVADAMADDE